MGFVERLDLGENGQGNVGRILRQKLGYFNENEINANVHKWLAVGVGGGGEEEAHAMISIYGLSGYLGCLWLTDNIGDGRKVFVRHSEHITYDFLLFCQVRSDRFVQSA